MYSKEDLKRQIAAMGIQPWDTLLVHSSMKTIGPVEGGADTVLDAFCEYLAEGLLVLPTHTWDRLSGEYSVFDVENEPSCVGLLTNLFRKRPGVLRSWHPTHSVAAFGRGLRSLSPVKKSSTHPAPERGATVSSTTAGPRCSFFGSRSNPQHPDPRGGGVGGRTQPPQHPPPAPEDPHPRWPPAGSAPAPPQRAHTRYFRELRQAGRTAAGLGDRAARQNRRCQQHVS